MIDSPERERMEAPAVVFRQMYCAVCRGKLARVSLVPGAYAEDRCHHSVVDADGKRRTCGHVTRVGPTR